MSATFYIIKISRINQKYLTGLLNSKLIAFWLKNRGKMQGNNFQLDKEPLLELPIIKPNNDIQSNISNIVEEILINKKNNIDTLILENKVDNLIYKLYDLTYDEVIIIEPDFEMNEVDYENYKL